MKKIEIATELVSVMTLNNMMSYGHVYTDEEKAHMIEKTANNNSKEKLEQLLSEELDRKARLETAQERERRICNFTNSEEGREAEAELKEALKAWKNDIIDEIHVIVNDVLGRDASRGQTASDTRPCHYRILRSDIQHER